MRGRPPKPLELQRKQGNPRKRAAASLRPVALALDAAGADGTQLNVPDWLPEGAMAIWCALVETPVLSAVLKGSDAFLFGRYCCRVNEWLVLNAMLVDGRSAGGIRMTQTEKRRGYSIVKARPELALRRDAESDMRAMEAQMGLTPAARASLFARLANVQDPTRPGKPIPWSGARAADDPALPPAPDSPLGILRNRRPPSTADGEPVVPPAPASLLGVLKNRGVN